MKTIFFSGFLVSCAILTLSSNDAKPILGGVPSETAKRPWVAELLDGNTNEYLCGGVILREDHVMSGKTLEDTSLSKN